MNQDAIAKFHEDQERIRANRPVAQGVFLVYEDAIQALAEKGDPFGLFLLALMVANGFGKE